ncbi:MAG: Holliday junction branch migration protein RuvA [Clostridiales bacterium]|nr:Holliday junction branch migration protein RuvA [Clostridiales bacterium]
MYSYISGTLEEVREDYIVVDNQGIGYQIYVPLRLMDELPGTGHQVKIYTYLYVREDAFMLYGFVSRDELSMFLLLINVSGIGPKGAIAILSSLSANDIRFAVVSDDDKTISRAPGVGKKTAQRLIIELKDKVSLDDALETASTEAPVSVYSGNSVVRKETIEALTALGYSASDAAHVLAGIEITDEDDVETILKQALKNMAIM